MKYRTMRRDTWRRAVKRRTAGRAIERNGLRGRESVIVIDEASAPLIVGTPDGKKLCVADKGYVWYQRAFEGEETWLTAAFDEKGVLLQLYFDVTAGNEFVDPDDPGFRDLYLDVILTPGHGIGVLDRDELDEALRTGDVTKAEYDRVLEVGRETVEMLERHGKALCREVTAAAMELVESMNPRADVVAALIWDGDRFLICRRPAHKARALLWEFVGGKVEKGETKEEALRRECREELDIDLAVGTVFCEVTHVYPDLTVRLTLFNASISGGEIRLLEHVDAKWITPAEIGEYEFCPADREILIKLAEGEKGE
ncbi:MAG: NUDIX domain-containing protein [Clostridia bacterium]|nr:NUDIX domain-containing protein [Clostridia bacterium]